MIDDKQVLEAIKQQYPDMAIPEETSPYKTFNSISDYAIGLAGADNPTKLQNMLNLIGQHYADGTGVVKNCIHNVFLFKFLRRAACSHNRRSLLEMIPQNLRPMLSQHMHGGGI